MSASDHNDATSPKGAEAGPVEPGAGRLLRAARLERGLSIEDVARQLRLSTRQVTALEADDYSKLSSVTFLRGFVRNYAKLLRMDAAPLLQRVQESLPPPQTPTISYQIEGIPFPSHRNQGKRNLIIGGAVFVALLLLVYEIYRGNEVNMGKLQTDTRVETGTQPERTDATTQPGSPPATAMNNIMEAPAGADAGLPPADKADVPPAKADMPPAQQVSPPPVAPKPVDAPPQKPAKTEPVPAAVATENADEGANVVRLSFEGESWTEVKDGRGRLLLSRINPRGTQQVLQGKPPFSLTIGNAAEVKLVYNNRPVDLARYTNAYGGTARLSLE